MFRGLKAIFGHPDGSTPRRRCRRCLPTLAGSTSCLEERVLLSGAGAHAHASQVVTRMYESILGTAPTSAQLTTWVDKLHKGVSSKVLHRDLLATVRSEQLRASAASIVAIDIGSSTPTSTLSSTGSSSTTMGSSSTVTGSSGARFLAPLVNTLSSPSDLAAAGLNVQQAPSLSALRVGVVLGSGGPGQSGHVVTVGGGGGKVTTTPTTTTTTSTPSTSTIGSTSTTSPTSPLQSLQAGSVPTPGLTTSTGSITSTLGQLGLSQVTQSQVTQTQLSVTPALTTSTTAPNPPSTGLTVAPTTGLTIAPTTGLTSAPTTGLTIAPSSNLI